VPRPYEGKYDRALVDEAEAVGDELGEDVGVEHYDDADDGG